MNNPFTLSFGIEPKEYIVRNEQISDIVGNFKSEEPSNHSYILSGVRGSGKTVTLSSITAELEKDKNWIVIDVSPDVDILNAVAAHLYSKRGIHNLFRNAKIDLSGLGIGVSLENAEPIYDITLALEELLTELRKKDYRVLIAIDEIVSNENVKVFAGVYQILVRKKLPVFLIMTGLYENINNLQNVKTLTFLYRAPKVYLKPLNMFSIAQSYSKVFGMEKEKARQMAAYTGGYAYAYQVLGYLYWEKFAKDPNGHEPEELLDEYDRTLSEYVYEKIWYELPETEERIVTLLIRNGRMKNQEIREELDLTDKQMSVYRDRLKRRGIIDVSSYGYLDILLPRFREIASFWTE